jgi:hypothetical protein
MLGFAILLTAPATSIIMCQEERGARSPGFVFVGEDGEEDAVHRRPVLENSHRPCPPPDFTQSSFDGGGGSHALSPSGRFVAEAGWAFVEVVAQPGDRLRVFGAEAIGETARREPRP